MDLKFSFGESNPLPISGAGSSSTPSAGASTLELRVRLSSDAHTGDVELMCEGVSGDGVSYARATKRVVGDDPAAYAAALRSVLARAGAELPEPLLGSVTGVVLDLDGRESAALTSLGLAVSNSATQLAAVDAALQARTGIAAGLPITVGATF